MMLPAIWCRLVILVLVVLRRGLQLAVRMERKEEQAVLVAWLMAVAITALLLFLLLLVVVGVGLAL